MKKSSAIIILTLLIAFSLSGQSYPKLSNPSYRYVSSPGFVNITGIEGALGLRDSTSTNSKYYFSLSNVFGYQADRNFFTGIGVGLYFCDNKLFVPVYLENKYSFYLKGAAPYFYASGGLLQSIDNYFDESKIFINPGIGISRCFSSRIEGSLSVGFMLQARTTLERVSFLNFKLSIIYRENPFRMFKKTKHGF